MREYLEKILDGNQNIIHGVYEPPNNIPILRYCINKKGLKPILIADTEYSVSCLNWLKTENIFPTLILNNLKELDFIDKRFRYFVIISNPNYKYVSYQQQMISQFAKNGIVDYLCPYDYEKIPKHDISYLVYFEKHRKDILDMLSVLHDEESKKTYVEYIRTKMFCDFYRLKQHPTWEKYFDEDAYRHLDNESFVNCGSSNGDTLFYFLEKFDNFEQYYGFESNIERTIQFNQNLGYLPDYLLKRIKLFNCNVDNKNSKIDDLLYDKYVSLINMDIEGMELDAIKGAKETIRKFEPVIAACAYHLPSDLYELPMLLKEYGDYEIFYRKYASTVRNRFCNAEMVMYAVPKKRLVK